MDFIKNEISAIVTGFAIRGLPHTSNMLTTTMHNV